MTKVVSGARFVDDDGEVHAIVWKTPHNHDTNAESDRTALLCTDETKTQQHFKDECDINVIVDRFLKTNQLPQLTMTPMHGIWDEEFDFMEAQNRIAETNAMFYRLPAALRSSYNNDPAAWRQDVLTRYDKGDLKPLEEMGFKLPAGAAPGEQNRDPPADLQPPKPDKPAS